jgi:putative membrane protein
MKKITRKLILAAFLVAGFTAAPMVDSVAQTQQRTTTKTTTTTHEKTSHDKENLTDAEFVRKVSAGNLAEIELSRLALERASSNEVKQFAQHMIDQHTQANQELQSVLSRATQGGMGTGMGTGADMGTGTGMNEGQHRQTDDVQRGTVPPQGSSADQDAGITGQPSGTAGEQSHRRTERGRAGERVEDRQLEGIGAGSTQSQDIEQRQRDAARTDQTGTTRPGTATDNNLDTRDQAVREGHSDLQGDTREGRMPQDDQMRQGDATGTGMGARTGMGEAEALSANLIATEMRAEDRATYNRLQRLRGAEFDRAYMDEMLKDHDKTVMLFEKQARDGNNQELRSFAQENLDMIKEHRDMAKKAHPDKSKKNK